MHVLVRNNHKKSANHHFAQEFCEYHPGAMFANGQASATASNNVYGNENDF